VATIYYLNWDDEAEEHSDATELFHDLHGGEPPAQIDADAFEDLYREVARDVHVGGDVETVWAGWNRGSGRESDRFLELRRCERCDTYIDGSEEAVTHAAQNHGYDAMDDPGEPDYLRGERSMSVGDVVEIDGRYYMAAAIGWQEVEVDG
jgi:hypothetical protein